MAKPAPKLTAFNGGHVAARNAFHGEHHIGAANGANGEHHTSSALSLECCTLCPRKCGVNRENGELGICGESSDMRLARAALHMWEEPPLSGIAGSGTVFFSGCNLHCIYCQNAPISTGKVGKTVSVKRLAEIFLELQGQGALNINCVTGTHFVPQIISAIDLAREQGLSLPIVWNTSGYESLETLQQLDGYVDVYLTDFKYASSELALRYSNASDYNKIASKALDAMALQVLKTSDTDKLGEAQSDTTQLDMIQAKTTQLGNVQFDTCAGCDESFGRMTKGVIVRILLLPGHLDDAKKVLDLLAAKPYASKLYLSLMSQYTPQTAVKDHFSELDRCVTQKEYDAFIDYALMLGFGNSFMQEGSSAQESFIPNFNYEGL